ncbi:MAG: glycosyltransferase family 4 protein [Bacteroidales bacterium]|nr:glycosyltransferase family 4 protein [Bacteroidales bacterium]MCF8344427.1 glycosyltransferase family 4 protein [Bacteroidales bacterium]MCF8351448.1 glycosyltransferase family 4 protein [Bacteroidales bacterium]MCF8375628.1 glycosyltransferase family 4 protein [Bacteroidales bacterium]MCF8400789.1 glycosyltransferase family 4 protein [Bacteroidales bacterium]
MKKVLVITYYWPPSGGAGVQRWLKFIKYLRDFGWEPVVYTPENPEAPVIDHSLEKDVPENIEVIRRPIWEPYSAYKRFIGQNKDERINAGFLSENKKPKLTENFSVWIRGNLFIPDARKYWIRPSIKFLKTYLKENPVDAMVTTGPPHSMHMIGLGLKKALDIPWLADFRDPWTNIDFYDQLKLTKWADRRHRRMEMLVLKQADKFVTVSWNWAKDFQEILKRPVHVITNGYDGADFQNIERKKDEKFSIVHIGAMNKDRNPEYFWKAIKELLAELPELKHELELRLIGSVDALVKESIAVNQLGQFLIKMNNIPHREVLEYTTSAQVLLLALNDTPNVAGIIPGKIFEYIAAKRPIICIGPEAGDSARIIHETSAGKVADFSDKDKMKEIIKEYFNKYLKDQLQIKSSEADKYSRKNLCGKIAHLLNEIKT